MVSQLPLFVIVAAHAALQLLDLATTFLALQAGAIEANPLSRAAIEHSWSTYSAIKIVLALLFLASLPLLRGLRGGERRLVFGAMGFFAAFMAFVVVNNAVIAF